MAVIAMFNLQSVTQSNFEVTIWALSNCSTIVSCKKLENLKSSNLKNMKNYVFLFNKYVISFCFFHSIFLFLFIIIFLAVSIFFFSFSCFLICSFLQFSLSTFHSPFPSCSFFIISFFSLAFSVSFITFFLPFFLSSFIYYFLFLSIPFPSLFISIVLLPSFRSSSLSLSFSFFFFLSSVLHIRLFQDVQRNGPN